MPFLYAQKTKKIWHGRKRKNKEVAPIGNFNQKTKNPEILGLFMDSLSVIVYLAIALKKNTIKFGKRLALYSYMCYTNNAFCGECA